MPALQFHPKHGVWKRFQYSSFYNNCLFFGHVLPRAFRPVDDPDIE
jgi:hypothetical protein